MKRKTELLVLAAALFFSGAGMVVHAYLSEGESTPVFTDGTELLTEKTTGLTLAEAESGEEIVSGFGESVQSDFTDTSGPAAVTESGQEVQTGLAAVTETEQTVQTELAAVTESGQDEQAGPAAMQDLQTGVVEEGNLFSELDGNSQPALIPFNRAGSTVSYHEAGEAVYFVAEDKSASGKYGFVAENVGSCGNRMLDICFTVDGFKDYVYDKNGEKVTGLYPAFGFRTDGGLSMVFAGPDQNIRIEILEHGTDTPVKGTYGFRWLDIDAGQRFGLSAEDGLLADSFTPVSSTLSFEEGFSRMKREYRMVYAAQDTAYITGDGDWLQGTVYWEVQDCSRMNLLIAAAGYSDRGRYQAKTWRSRYEEYRTGIFPSSVDRVLGSLEWDGETFYDMEVY